MELARNISEQEAPVERARIGLRKLLKHGRVAPPSVLNCPELLSLTQESAGDSSEAEDAILVSRAVIQAVENIEQRDAARLLFGLGTATADRALRDRRKAAAKVVKVTPESFRVRREARLLDELAHALLIELADSGLANSESAGPGASRHPVVEKIQNAVAQSRSEDPMLAFGLWNVGAAGHLGRVIEELKGRRRERRIADGYQYVGSYPAHMWRVATADLRYQTLSYGIKTFMHRWHPLRHDLDRPFHYVSIGPGTGEKDNAILTYLQSLPGASSSPIAYLPIDISTDLLGMSLDTSMRAIDNNMVELIPIELDIASPGAVEVLQPILGALPADHGILISVLGNTLANFRDDTEILRRVSSLLRPASDVLLLELATTRDVSDHSAALAESEYEGSMSFRAFVLAALSQYTDCTSASGDIVHRAKSIDDALEIATFFRTRDKLKIAFVDGDYVSLRKGETIRLYTSRKYTGKAIEMLLAEHDLIARSDTTYRQSEGFGLATLLLRAHL